MTDLADRVRIIAHTLHGSVLDTEDDVMHVEIPADLAGAAASLFGAGGFSAVIIGQTTRMQPRRLLDLDKRTVIDHDAEDLMAFYSYRIELIPHAAQQSPQPSAAKVRANPNLHIRSRHHPPSQSGPDQHSSLGKKP